MDLASGALDAEQTRLIRAAFVSGEMEDGEEGANALAREKEALVDATLPETTPQLPGWVR